MDKQISIIIATFNAGKTLKRCLESIGNQKSEAIELLVIDGDSKDNTLQIIKDYGSVIDYYCSEKDEGLYDAWNKGIHKASGQWIMFLGADDILLEGALSKYLSWIIENDPKQIDIVSGKAKLVDNENMEVGDMGEPYDYNVFKYRFNISHGSTLHNKKMFKELGLFDINFKICGDYELLLRKPLKSAFIDDFFIRMQKGGMSMTLKARREPFYARKKNHVLPLWKNWLLREREIWGYVFKYCILQDKA